MAKEKKKERPIIQKMLAALIGGIVLGLIFMMVRQNMLDSGNEATWSTINKLLFQDITAADGIGAIGIFYIIGQIFMKGLQAAIVPLVLVSLSLALCSNPQVCLMLSFLRKDSARQAPLMHSIHWLLSSMQFRITSHLHSARITVFLQLYLPQL